METINTFEKQYSGITLNIRKNINILCASSYVVYRFVHVVLNMLKYNLIKNGIAHFKIYFQHFKEKGLQIV